MKTFNEMTLPERKELIKKAAQLPDMSDEEVGRRIKEISDGMKDEHKFSGMFEQIK